MSGDPVDVRNWFDRWLTVNVVAGRGYRVDAFQHAMIDQAREIMEHLDHGMLVSGIDHTARRAALAYTFVRITGAADNDLAARLAYQTLQLDPAAIADLLAQPPIRIEIPQTENT